MSGTTFLVLQFLDEESAYPEHVGVASTYEAAQQHVVDLRARDEAALAERVAKWQVRHDQEVSDHRARVIENGRRAAAGEDLLFISGPWFSPRPRNDLYYEIEEIPVLD